MKSQAIVCALVVLCSALSVSSSAASTYIQAKADQGLMKFMMQPRAGSVDTVACFNYYIPILNGLTEDYEKNFQACITTQNNAISALDEKGTEIRDNITTTSTDVCKLYSQCQALTDNLEFFDCYSNLGDQTVRVVYSISQNASDAASKYRESRRVIVATCEMCQNETSRAYVTQTADTYTELENCLANGLKITTVSTTTVEDTTTPAPTVEPSTEPATTTTDAVTTTTEAASTTTEVPTTTTEAATPTTEAVTTTTEVGTTTAEKDPVEELTLAEQTARNRLENFVKSWNKRST